LPSEPHRRLRQFEGRPGVGFELRSHALTLTVSKGDIRVSVVVPESVLEWFVDVERSESGSRATDWVDYEGYGDDTDPEGTMAEEVAYFVNQLIERNLRYTEDAKRPARGVLEWHVNGQWHQAVPFVVPTA